LAGGGGGALFVSAYQEGVLYRESFGLVE